MKIRKKECENKHEIDREILQKKKTKKKEYTEKTVIKIRIKKIKKS